MLSLDSLIRTETIKLEGIGISNPWRQSIAIGLSTKAFMHLRLFNISIGSESVPVGIESIVQLFEPWLLGSIELSEFNTVRRYLQPCITVYPTLDSVKKTVKDNIPLTLSGSVREAFKIDVDKAEQVTDLMELYLRRFGKENFERIFPLPHI